jgi:hypothetical protein
MDHLFWFFVVLSTTEVSSSKIWCSKLIEKHSSPNECGNNNENGEICMCDSISIEGESIDQVGFVNPKKATPTFLSSRGIDWWLFHNHAKHFEVPSLFFDFSSSSSNPGGSDTFFMERCLNWRGYCSADTSGITSARRRCTRVKVQDFSRSSASPFRMAPLMKAVAGIVMTLDTNSAIGRMLLSDGVGSNVSPDIVIAYPAPARVDSLFRGVMSYRKLPQQFSFDADIAVYVRPGYDLGIEREGYQALPFPRALEQKNAAPSARSAVSCEPTTVVPIREDKFERMETEKKLLTRSNKGYGCLIQDCQRHLPQSFPLSTILKFSPSCIGYPRTLAHKRIQLFWKPSGANSTLTPRWDYEYPVTYMDWKKKGISTAAQICRTSNKEVGILSRMNECIPKEGIVHGRQLTKPELKGFDVLSIIVRLSGMRFKAAEATRGVSFSLVRDMLDRYLTDSDRRLVQAVSGSPFSKVMNALQQSTKGELAAFLSSAKYAVHPGNTHGVHILRVLLAERILDARRAALGYHGDRLVQRFRRDGIVVIPMNPLGLSKQQRLELHRLFQYAIGSKEAVEPSFRFFKVDVIHNELDIQHQMHMDTFSSITKVFGFVEAVQLKDGPFNYVNKSHRHGTEKLRLIHKLVSLDEYVACESPRVYPSHQKEYGLNPIPIVVPPKSIVVADTNGYHFRGMGTPGERRDYYTTTWGGARATNNIGGLPRIHPFCGNLATGTKEGGAACDPSIPLAEHDPLAAAVKVVRRAEKGREDDDADVKRKPKEKGGGKKRKPRNEKRKWPLSFFLF